MAIKNQKTSKKSPDTKTLVAIGIALIGVIGTIVAALITAVFSFLSTKAQVELPISATQTAEAKFLISTHTPLPSFTQTPTIAQNLEWENYLGVEKKVQCNDIILLPPDSDYSENAIEKITQVISNAYKNEDVYSWAKIPEIDDEMYNAQQVNPTFDIDNVSSQDWIEVSKVITVSISTEKDIPEKINAVRVGGGCGGGGETRNFSSLNLDTNFEQYTDKAEFTEFDFFKLEIGEFERFRFSFSCKNPGYYRLNFNIPYQIRNTTGEIQTNVDIVCPHEVTLWFYDMMSNKVMGISGSYFWDGSGYVSK
jgi:flagellar basal body-associated protein FliL